MSKKSRQPPPPEQPKISDEEYLRLAPLLDKDVVAVLRKYEDQGLRLAETAAALIRIAAIYAVKLGANQAKFANLAHRSYYEVVMVYASMEQERVLGNIDAFDSTLTDVLRKDRPK